MEQKQIGSRSYKERNRGILLRLIGTKRCTSRIELAEYTGLTKMGVSKIVGEFIESGLVEEGGVKQNDDVGRNPIKLRISARAKNRGPAHI